MVYRIKGWSKFQHFKDRRPPWVKLYRDLLEDPDWHELDGEAAKMLVALWLIASEDDSQKGTLPDSRRLAFRLRITETKVNQTLTKLSHWLVQDDINVISQRYQLDAPETETETETESVTTSVNRLRGTRFALEQLPEDWKTFCLAERKDLNPQKCFDAFADYWSSLAGQKAVKLDWFKTWKNWVRNQRKELAAAKPTINEMPWI